MEELRTKIERMFESMNRFGKRKFIKEHRSRRKAVVLGSHINFQTHKPSCQCRGTGIVKEQRCQKVA